MKKICAIMLIFCLVMLFASCGEDNSVESGNGLDQTMEDVADTANEEDSSSLLQDKIFSYNGKDYDLAQRDSNIISMTDVITLNDYILISADIGNGMSYYGIFDTVIEDFIGELYANNLIWHSDEIFTIVYTWGSTVLDLNANVIGECNLVEGELIQGIRFTENNTKVEAEVLRLSGDIEYLEFDVIEPYDENGNLISQQDQSTEKTVPLYAAFDMGGIDGSQGLISQYEFTYTGDLTAELIVQGLIDLTGYDFNINSITVDGDAVTVDWASDADLFTAGDGDTWPKEGFLIIEIEGIRWFMLDSLYLSIMYNSSFSELYYTMDGGQELVVEGLNPISSFGLNQPYMGSTYYYNM